MRRGIVCLGIGAVLAAGPAWSQPELTLERDRIEITVDPGASIALVGALRTSSNSVSVLAYHSELLTDDDSDGVIAVDLGGETPWRSVWVAVDRETGEFLANTPVGFPLRVMDLPEDLHPGAASLRHLATTSTMLVVRPGGGVWVHRLRDGGPQDEEGDSSPGVSGRLESFESLDPSQIDPIQALKPGDAIVLLDGRKMIATVGILDPSGDLN